MTAIKNEDMIAAEERDGREISRFKKGSKKHLAM